MKATLIACLALAFLPVPQSTRLAEPPQEFVLQGNGKECELRIGQPLVLPKEFEGQKVTLRVRPTRLFDYKGLKFRYPQNFSWLYEAHESGEQFVTLAGQTSVLQLCFYAEHSEPGRLVDSMALAISEKLGPRAQQSAGALTGKDKRALPGKRIEHSESGQKRTQEVYGVRLADEVVILVLQDTCTEAGKPDPETEGLLKLLAESLEWPK